MSVQRVESPSLGQHGRGVYFQNVIKVDEAREIQSHSDGRYAFKTRPFAVGRRKNEFKKMNSFFFAFVETGSRGKGGPRRYGLVDGLNNSDNNKKIK